LSGGEPAAPGRKDVKTGEGVHLQAGPGFREDGEKGRKKGGGDCWSEGAPYKKDDRREKANKKGKRGALRTLPLEGLRADVEENWEGKKGSEPFGQDHRERG